MEAFMKSWKPILLIVVVALTIMSLLLSACGPIDNSNGNPNKEKNKDNGNQKEKDNGKDQEQDQAGNGDRITICHRTGSPKKPYVQISISGNGATNGHAKHAGDLIPAPEDGCPATVVTDVPAK
jgi:hypothetical protein